MEKLKVTNYGTIVGEHEFEETKISDFLKKLEKDIQFYHVHYNSNDSSYITLDANVYIKSDNNYEIVIDSFHYSLDISSSGNFYPILKSKLDKLNEVSNKKTYMKKVINDFEKNANLDEHNNSEDLKIYLKYLLKRKKEYSLKKILLALRGLYGPISLLMLFVNITEASLILTIFAMCVWLTDLLTQFLHRDFGEETVLDRFKALFKRAKLNAFKVKELTKRLNKTADINFKIDNYEKETPIKRDVYKDAIINYMNNIMVGANKLNPTIRIKKLNELKMILDEYLKRMQEFNNNKEKGLTLENDEHVIAREILDKLTTLEMEIAEFIRRDNENKKVSVDGDVLMGQIDKCLYDAKVEETYQNKGKKRALTRN